MVLVYRCMGAWFRINIVGSDPRWQWQQVVVQDGPGLQVTDNWGVHGGAEPGLNRGIVCNSWGRHGSSSNSTSSEQGTKGY